MSGSDSVHRGSRPASSRRGAAGSRGEVVLEAAIALPLILVVVLGLVQQFSVTAVQLDHSQLATELMLGPQGPSMWYDRGDSAATPPISPGFRRLAAPAGGGSPNPDLDDFFEPLERAIERSAPPDATVFMRLGYIEADSSTGVTTGWGLAGSAPTTVVGSAVPTTSPCRARGAQLDTYAETALGAMRSHATALGANVAVAPKLFGVKIGSQEIRGYVPYIPFLFILVCSESVTGLWPQYPVSTYTLVPRSLVN